MNQNEFAGAYRGYVNQALAPDRSGGASQIFTYQNGEGGGKHSVGYRFSYKIRFINTKY